MSLSPGLIDLILALIALEGIALSVWLARRGAGALIGPVICFLLSGAALMVALRGAVAGWGMLLIQAALLASLILHLACLALGWRAWRARR